MTAEQPPAPSRDMETATNDNPAPTPAEPSERLSLDDLKNLADVNVERIERHKDGQSIERPWRRSDKPSGRDRTPDKPKYPK